MQRLEAKNRLQNGKFKWQDPGMVDLTRANKRARGDCTPGSGDADLCLANGMSAIGNCLGSGSGYAG